MAVLLSRVQQGLNLMGVRKTESRIPATFQASDLGQAIVAGDERCTLISVATAPIVVNRENVYVVFVTDEALAGVAQSYEWTFQENENTPQVETTEHGENTYKPLNTGNLKVVVRILGAGNAEQASLTLTQQVMLPNSKLEALITSARNEPGPGVANPDVARELINEHNLYYQSVTLQTPETGDGFQRFVFSMVFEMVFEGALQSTIAERRRHLDALATSLNSQVANFVTLAAKGAGVCGIRLALLAMTLPKVPGNPDPLLNWTELPEAPDKRVFADEELRNSMAALDEPTRIDLFNLARFPKSNITRCGRILEALRDRYFGGTSGSPQ
jgi:hypothetical protein